MVYHQKLAVSLSFCKCKRNLSHQPSISGVRIAASGMAWKATDSEKVITVAASVIKWAQWLRVARNYQLRIGTLVENKNGSKDQRKEKFDGFQREVGLVKTTWIMES